MSGRSYLEHLHTKPSNDQKQLNTWHAFRLNTSSNVQLCFPLLRPKQMTLLLCGYLQCLPHQFLSFDVKRSCFSLGSPETASGEQRFWENADESGTLDTHFSVSSHSPWCWLRHRMRDPEAWSHPKPLLGEDHHLIRPAGCLIRTKPQQRGICHWLSCSDVSVSSLGTQKKM